MSEAIDHCSGEDFIAKNFFPSVKSQISSDDSGTPSGPEGEVCEEHFSSLFVEGNVPKFITNNEVMFLEPAFQLAQCFLGTRLPNLCQQAVNGGKKDGKVFHASLDTESNGEVCFAGSGVSGEDDILPIAYKIESFEQGEFCLGIVG